MAHDWFIVRNGKEHGPHTAQQFKQMAASGKLQPDDKVRRSDMKAAIKASAIKGLFAATLASTTTPPSSESAPPATPKKAGPSKKTLIIASVVGGACLLLCCGGFGLIGVFAPKARNTTSKEQADSGTANGASSDQVSVVDSPLTTISESVTQNPFQLSADGNYLLANGWAVWNVKTGKKLQSPESFLWSRLSPSGKRLAAIQVGSPKRLVIFSLEADALVVQQKVKLGHRDCFGPWWSDDEKQVVVTCGGPIIQAAVDEPPEDQHGFVVTLGEGDPKVVRYVHPDHGHKVTYPDPYFSSDGKFLAVTFDEPSVRVFETATGKHMGRLEAGQTAYNFPASKKEKWELRLVPRDDGRIEVWHVAENRLAAVLGKSDGVNRSFRTITPDGRFVASAQHEKRGIEIWDTESGQKVSVKDYKQGLASSSRPDYLNVKAPPISDATYEQIRVGMTTLQVWKLVGGRPYDDKSMRHEEGRLGTDWIMEEVEYYHSKDHPGARIVLIFRGKGTAPPLVKKSIVR